MATTQTVTVRIDGDIVDQHVLVDDAWHTLSYPVEARSEASPFCIEFADKPCLVRRNGRVLGCDAPGRHLTPVSTSPTALGRRDDLPVGLGARLILGH